MTDRPYTYVTLAIVADQRPRIGVSFHTSDLQVRALLLEAGRPYLSLESEEANISISTSGAGPVTATDVEVARQLFNAAARYLSDCERLHEQQSTNVDQATLPGIDGETAA